MMAEFSGGEEKLVRENEPIVFENKTDSSFDVGMGVIFHKSGIYEVSILGNRTTVSKVAERKTGKWIQNDDGTYSCSLCQSRIPEEQYYYARFCLYCGADLRWWKGMK